MYIIQALKGFGFTKFYIIEVSHFFSDNSDQSSVFSWVPHYAVVQNKILRAFAPVLCKKTVLLFLKFTLSYYIKIASVQQLLFLLYIRSHVWRFNELK